jgi:hypothetical protein
VVASSGAALKPFFGCAAWVMRGEHRLIHWQRVVTRVAWAYRDSGGADIETHDQPIGAQGRAATVPITLYQRGECPAGLLPLMSVWKSNIAGVAQCLAVKNSSGPISVPVQMLSSVTQPTQSVSRVLKRTVLVVRDGLREPRFGTG